MFCNTKRQVTVPQEFHFATNKRVPPPAKVADLLFDKVLIYCHVSYYHLIVLPLFSSHRIVLYVFSFPLILNFKMTKLFQETPLQIPSISPLRYVVFMLLLFFLFLFLAYKQFLMAWLFFRNEVQRKRGNCSPNFYMNKSRRRGPEFTKQLHIHTPLIIQWYSTNLFLYLL